MKSRLRFRGGRHGLVLLVVAALVSFGAWDAWTALAQGVVAPTTPNPLPGSQFQGGDGNQDDAPGLIDWQGLQLDGRVGHTSDPQAQDNIFAGGTKELQPGSWALTTQAGGATPPKDNILDIYRAFDRPPAGDAFLYLAFTREAGNGTTFLTFELNQDPRLWTNSAGDQLPCRTTGDILITFTEQGNGVQVQVDRWVTDSSLSNGCADTGHLVPASNLTPNVDVQGSFNSGGAITNFLPGLLGSPIPTDQFGETAINLTTVLGGLGEQCAVFGSTWAHSRSSSDSATSQLQDYVAPQPFRIRTCKASPTLTSSATGTVNRKARGRHRLRRHLRLARSLQISDTATLSGGDNPTGPITFNLYDNTACAGTPIFTDTQTANGAGSYRSGFFTVTAPGTYVWVVTYSGDVNNNAAGPTACGDQTEQVTISRASPTLSTTAVGPLRLRRVAVGPRRHRRLRTVRVRTARAGRQIYDTASLQGGLAPTGTITFKLYGPGPSTCTETPLFTSTPVTVSGNGTYTSEPFTVTAAGTYRWVATYSGDGLNNPVGPTGCDDEIVEISKAHTTISTVASPATTPGNPITDTAVLGGGSDPSGTITFTLYGPGDGNCSSAAISTSTRTVTANGTYTSDPYTPTAEGTYHWIASYSGDPNNDAATTSCGDLGEDVTVSPPPPTQPTLSTSLSSTAGPVGSPITDVAHLRGGSNPTGSITFKVYGPGDDSCTGHFVIVSTANVTGNDDYPSGAFSPPAVGTYHWVASYSGDGHNAAVATPCLDETVVVSPAQPAFSTLATPSVILPGSTEDTATIRGANPTGTIVFRLFGPTDDTCTSPAVFTTQQNVVGNGTYTSGAFAPPHPGTYRWIATYSGDTNNNAEATLCNDTGEVTTLLPGQPLLSTSASPPAFLRTGRRVRAAGSSIYDSALLANGVQPTGQITFDLYGPTDPMCSGPPIFTTATTVNGNGIYNSESFTPTVSGTYRWRATYSGDADNNGAGPTGCADPAERVQVTLPADVQLITTASDAVTLGGAVSDTAHVSGGAAPTGTLTFRLYAPNDTSCTGSPVFTSTVAVNGNGDYTSQSFVPSAAGAYRWVVHYSGDHANNPAGPTVCGEAGETVVVRPGDITPVTPAFSTTASPPPEAGGTLYDTALLSGGIAPTGAITFELFGPGNATCTGTPAFVTTVAVSGNGNYRSTSFLATAPGSYRWVASYSGDALNTPAGPTACGDPAETSTVTSPDASKGANVSRPPTAKPKPKPKPKKPKRSPVAPGFTG